MKVFTCSLFVLALWAACLAEESAYSGYKVFQVTPKTIEQAEILKKLEEHGDRIDFWSTMRHLNQPVDIMVAPEIQLMFNSTLHKHGLQYTELISNVADVLEKERMSQFIRTPLAAGDVSFDRYLSYPEIQEYFNRIAFEHPDIVTLYNAGYSYEGRQIYLIKISTGGNKPGFLIDGGIHAREWIAPAMVLYIVDQLIENPANRQLIESVDWYIIPSINPDGYVYTQASSANRFWRKTRSPGNLCDGTDCNRNFDFHWMAGGASTNQCSETYGGPNAMSEAEARVFDSVLKYFDNVKLYVSFHSYGQYVLYPWGWTSDEPDNADELQALGDDVNAAISAVRGTQYKVGPTTTTLYMAAGTSTDYAAGVGGIDASYTIELPGGGRQGFDLPPEEIIPVVTETWEGVKVLHNYVANLK